MIMLLDNFLISFWLTWCVQDESRWAISKFDIFVGSLAIVSLHFCLFRLNQFHILTIQVRYCFGLCKTYTQMKIYVLYYQITQRLYCWYQLSVRLICEIIVLAHQPIQLYIKIRLSILTTTKSSTYWRNSQL